MIESDMFEDPALRAEFKAQARRISVSEGTVMMEPGMTMSFVPIVIEGCIRVLRQTEDGSETFLYHIMPGETCALSLNCCSTNAVSGVKTVAETDTDFWSIPMRFVEEWQKYAEWRSFVANTFQSRFDRLLNVIDDIAFHHMDQRLWSYLLARSVAQNSDLLHITHDEIAQEMNIQREAATRLIRKLKELGYIETGRHEIRLLKKVAEV